MSGYRDPDAPQSPIADLFDAVGPSRFVLIIVAALAWAAALIWLSDKVNWPDGYGFRCTGKGCWIDEMWHSGDLLRRHSIYEIALFLCIWGGPAAMFGGIFIYHRSRKLRDRQSSVFSNPVE
jgi:hypothetical protein